MKRGLRRRAFVLFDGDRFCPGELQITDHLDEIKNQVLIYRGVQAEIASKLASSRSLPNRKLLEDSIVACKKATERLAEAYGALAHFSDVADDDL